MSHKLDGAVIKLKRARDHLQELKELLAKKIEAVSQTLTLSDDGQIVTAKLGKVFHADPELSAIIGDCLTNLRASLDYIAWELASKYAGRPLTIGKDKL